MRRAQYEQLKKIASNIIDRFVMFPATKQRVVISVARHVLLNAPYMINGVSYDIKSKSLGAGVYELSIKEYTS